MFATFRGAESGATLRDMTCNNVSVADTSDDNGASNPLMFRRPSVECLKPNTMKALENSANLTRRENNKILENRYSQHYKIQDC